MLFTIEYRKQIRAVVKAFFNQFLGNIDSIHMIEV